MTNKNIIAIDGPAASGKGTLARLIADHLDYAHMDTGLLYRAVAWQVMQARERPEDPAAAIRAAHYVAGRKDTVLLQNQELRGDAMAEAAAKVATIQDVRKILFDLQRSFATNPGKGYAGAVLDGRDIGTVICPDATVKFFVTASQEIRARRRLNELQSRGISTTYEAVLRDMRERDERDADRITKAAQAVDAIFLDTTDLTPAQALEQALTIIEERLSWQDQEQA
jgi:CMP/dCMP kinase